MKSFKFYHECTCKRMLKASHLYYSFWLLLWVAFQFSSLLAYPLCPFWLWALPTDYTAWSFSRCCPSMLIPFFRLGSCICFPSPPFGLSVGFYRPIYWLLNFGNILTAYFLWILSNLPLSRLPQIPALHSIFLCEYFTAALLRFLSPVSCSLLSLIFVAFNASGWEGEAQAHLTTQKLSKITKYFVGSFIFLP